MKKQIQNMKTEEKASLCSGLDFWHTKPLAAHGIPSVMMCDGPHGLRKQTEKTDHMGVYESIPAVCFPCASALAASFDRKMMADLGNILGQECRAEGVGMLLGPGLNIKRTPLCGRNFEYFSEDPYLTGALAVSYVQALQSNGVAACIKHFACNNQETDRMTVSSVVENRALREIYLPAFEQVVREAAPQAVMCAYNAVNGTFCSESKTLLTDILRKEWGFQGLVVTDWGAVKDRVIGLQAGLDLEMPGGEGAQDQKIVDAVRSGQLDEQILNDTAGRMLRFALQHSGYKGNIADLNKDHAAAIEMAKQCIVLLQNEAHLLPLQKNKRIALIGPLSKHTRYQGAGSSRVNAYRVENALEAMERRHLNFCYCQGYLETGEEDLPLFKQAVQAASDADVAIVFAGLPPKSEAEGYDRVSLDLPDDQNKLISEIARVQPNTVVVLYVGAPVLMPWQNEVKSILLAHLGGEGVAEAVVSVLTGETNPSGKIAETFPVRLEDTPAYLDFPGEHGKAVYREGIFVGYRYYDKRKMDVLFPFGHGLSYTSFEYRDLQLSKGVLEEGDVLEVSCRIVNTGTVRGKEVIQLYVGAQNSNVPRVIRALRGFEKVELEPGQATTVRFCLTAVDFSYYHEKAKSWYMESGTYRIEIGSSSRCLPLRDHVTVKGKAAPCDYDLLTPMGMVWQNPEGASFLKKVIVKAKALQWNDERTDVIDADQTVFQAVLNSLLSRPLGSLISYGAASEADLIMLIQRMKHAAERSIS